MSSDGQRVICDTNIFIHAFNQDASTIEALEQIGPEQIVLSTVIVMELVIGAWNKKELRRLEQRIQFYDTIELNKSISQLATKFIKQLHLSNGLQIPDALIAATAVTYQLPLFTYNLKDFRPIPGLVLHSPATL